MSIYEKLGVQLADGLRVHGRKMTDLTDGERREFVESARRAGLDVGYDPSSDDWIVFKPEATR